MSVSLGTPRPLPPIAARVDAELADMDVRIDWLMALSPIDNDAMWAAFVASGHRVCPPLRYTDPDSNMDGLREQLLALPIQDIESPLLSGLLSEKQRELDRQMQLVRLRDTDGFINASLDLFGGVRPALLELAEDILATVEPSTPLSAEAGIDEIVTAIEQEVHWYRERAPDFEIEIVTGSELNSLMMVSHGKFYIDREIRVPRARIQPLIQHEIGTHVLTRHNGSVQSLKQLEVGLAHYDPLQEGLGVLAEYLAGYLPGERLRVLAARVVASEMAIHGDGIPEIFDLLHNTHEMPTDDAFDVAVRALRGGGLTKDAVYLSGLRDLLDYLRDDGDFRPLFIGKFALSHLVVLHQLIDEGWVRMPQLLPRYLSEPASEKRLAACRKLSVNQLFQQEPA